MPGRKWFVSMAVVALAVIVGMIARNSSPTTSQPLQTTIMASTTPATVTSSTTALPGSDCSSYQLPKGAVAYMSAVAAEKNTITIVYRMADGSSGHELAVPFDAIDVTCTDPRIRELVTSAHKGAQEIRDSMCKSIADVLSGRIQVPPKKHYNLAYAQEWYSKSCPVPK